jgi:hypothetical protein
MSVRTRIFPAILLTAPVAFLVLGAAVERNWAPRLVVRHCCFDCQVGSEEPAPATAATKPAAGSTRPGRDAKIGAAAKRLNADHPHRACPRLSQTANGRS